MLDILKRNKHILLPAMLGAFFAMYMGIGVCYAAARVTTSALDHVPTKTWVVSGLTELYSTAYGPSLELIDYVKSPYVYTASSSPIIEPSPIAVDKFLNSIEQKKDAVYVSKVIGSMKTVSKCISQNNIKRPTWAKSYQATKWFNGRGFKLLSQFRNLRK